MITVYFSPETRTEGSARWQIHANAKGEKASPRLVYLAKVSSKHEKEKKFPDKQKLEKFIST